MMCDINVVCTWYAQFCYTTTGTLLLLALYTYRASVTYTKLTIYLTPKGFDYIV